MMVTNSNNKHARSAADCNSCGVCLLSCPVWRRTHDQSLTICGRARAEAAGASAEELDESARACILCGSCEPLCPRGMDTQGATISLRRRLAAGGLLPEIAVGEQPALSASVKTSRVLLPGAALRKRPDLLERCLALLGTGFSIGADDGTDIALDLESGRTIDAKRAEAFLEPLRTAKEIVASDGLLVNLLSPLLAPKTRVRGLGQVLLENSRVRSGVKSTDFFMIETRAFNGKRNSLVMLYEALRRETGCFMNMDLHRVATPTGSQSFQHRHDLRGTVSVEEQVRWLLEGRPAERIVVEHLDDGAAFEQHASLPVVHLAEVTEP